LLHIEATYKAEVINSAAYLNTKRKEDQFENIVKSHESNQLNMNSTIKKAANIVEELNQANEKSDTIKDGIKHTKGRLGKFLKRKWEKQCNEWPVQ
jgi:hypothetical protein